MNPLEAWLILFVYLLQSGLGHLTLRPENLQPLHNGHARLYHIEAGSNFSLSCRSETTQPILEANSLRFKKDPKVLPCNISASSKYKFCSMIFVNESSYLDVGRYTCKYGKHHLKGSKWMQENAEETSESKEMYIFVNDESNLRSRNVDYFGFFNFNEYDDGVLPCLPSHPNVTVELYKKTTSGMFAPPSRNFSYDSTIGFTLKNISSSELGAYYCKFSRGNRTSMFQIRVNVNHVPLAREHVNIPPRPMFEVVHGLHRRHVEFEEIVREGSNIQLFCNATLDFGGHVAKITWLHRGEKITPHVSEQSCDQPGNGEVTAANKNPTLNETNPAAAPKCIYSVIEINNASDSNTGEFVCLVKNHLGLQNNATVTIALADNDSLCQLRHVRHKLDEKIIDDDRCFSMKGRAEKQAVFVMDVLPFDPTRQAEILWVSPSGKVHSSLSYPPNKVGSPSLVFSPPTPSKSLATLNITNVSLTDDGNYTFYCRDSAETKIQFCLTVLDSPKAKMSVTNHQYDLFQIGKNYTLRCEASGNPEIIYFDWSLCSDGRNHCSSRNQSAIKDASEHRRFHFLSETNVTIGQDVKTVQCRACNEQEECGSSEEHILLPVDYYPPKPFVFGICIVMENGQCVEIEEVTTKVVRFRTESLAIICAGSKHKEQNPILSSYFFDLKDKISSENDFSTKEMFLFDQLAMEDDGGDISCGHLSLEIEVKDISPPQPLGSDFNMNTSNIRVKLGDQSESQIVIFNCSMSGIPKPKVTWKKDDEYLSEDEFKKSHLSFLDEDKTVLKVNLANQSDEGEYKCIAENLAGTVEYSRKIIFSRTLLYTIIALSVATLSVFLIILAVAIFCCRRFQITKDELNESDIAKFLRGDPHAINPSLPLEEQASLLPYDDEIEFPKDRLTLGIQIGCGAFGRVVLGHAVGISLLEPKTKVAVKMPKPPVTKQQLVGMMSEIKIMLHIGKHLNVVNLLGACTSDLAKRELYMIVEFCCHGNLQHFLLKRRNNFINLVNPETGIYEPDMNQKSAEQIHYVNDSRTLNYVKLELATSNNDLTKTGNQPTQKKVSEISNDSAFATIATDMTTGTNVVTDRLTRRPHRISVRSSDADLDSTITLTDMTSLASQSQSVRSGHHTHKTSMISADSQFDHVVNNTDMTDVTVGTRQSKDLETGEENASEVRNSISTKDLLSWAYQIAKGMEHLANKRIVHGDLAARNVLLAENNVVKIGDFGLAKNIYSNPNYHKTSSGPLPIKWMAIESLTYRIFSSQSDVWSYGIVLWELFSLARTPYPELDADESFQKKLEAGYRMGKPDYAPDEMYKVMNDCWLQDPECRPTFTELADKLGEELQEGEREHYLTLNTIYEEENEARQQKYVYLTQGQADSSGSCSRSGKSNDSKVKSTTSTNAKGNEASMSIEESHEDTPMLLKTSHTAFNNPGYGHTLISNAMGKKRKPSTRSLYGTKMKGVNGTSVECMGSSKSDNDVRDCKTSQVNEKLPGCKSKENENLRDDFSSQMTNLQTQASVSVSSTSSGFHSNSSDKLHRMHSLRRQRTFPSRPIGLPNMRPRYSLCGAESFEDVTPPPSYESTIMETSFTNSKPFNDTEEHIY